MHICVSVYVCTYVPVAGLHENSVPGTERLEVNLPTGVPWELSVRRKMPES